MNSKITIYVLILCGALSCQRTSDRNPPATSPVSNTPITRSIQSPDEQYGALFEAVQMQRVFPDSKTFADCTPKFAAADILRKYDTAKNQAGFDLKAFVLENFDPPVPHSTNFKSDLGRSPSEHVMALWPVLTRQPDSASNGTLLPLPHSYVVPGGRFGEIYYWDSYFTMLGLQVSNQQPLIDNMVKNFAYLLDTYGHIPNGNRAYYLSRSQPPFFSLMAKMTGPSPAPTGQTPWLAYLPQLEKEYAFWMDGEAGLSAQKPAHRRLVRLDDGTVLNRYWDDHAAPRPEAFREDFETAQAASARPAEEVYRNLKAAAESGWDFSSRWNIPSKDLTGINVTDMIPVDLNCLLWHLEQTLSEAYQLKGDSTQTQRFRQRAATRAQAILRLCYDPAAGWFMDYNHVQKRSAGVLSLAGMYPLFFKLAKKDQAAACARTLEKTFLRPGGLLTTPNHTTQQWDAPNGWAPLQWIAIAGLRNYDQTQLANTVKQRWVDLCSRVYQRTGKMLEKYNVEDLSLEAGGGEYPVQDGFGWTNGVLLRLLSEK